MHASVRCIPPFKYLANNKVIDRLLVHYKYFLKEKTSIFRLTSCDCGMVSHRSHHPSHIESRWDSYQHVENNNLLFDPSF